MSIDLTEAFKAPFSGKNKWFSYIGPNILLLIPIVNIFFMVVLCGALVKYMQNVYNKTDAEFSVFDDMRSSFSIGAKLALGGFVLAIPFYILIYISILLLGGNILDMMSNPISFIALYGVFMLIGFFAGIVYSLMMMNFSLDCKFTSMLDFQRALFLLKGNQKRFFITIVYIFVVGIVYSIAFSIPVLGLIVALFLFIPNILTFYNIYGQFLRDNKAVDVLKEVYKLN